MKWLIALACVVCAAPAFAQESNWWASHDWWVGQEEMLGNYAKSCKGGAVDLILNKDSVVEPGKGGKKTAISVTDQGSGGTTVTFWTFYFDLADSRKLEVQHASGGREGEKVTATVQDKAGKQIASYVKCK